MRRSLSLSITCELLPFNCFLVFLLRIFFLNVTGTKRGRAGHFSRGHHLCLKGQCFQERKQSFPRSNVTWFSSAVSWETYSSKWSFQGIDIIYDEAVYQILLFLKVHKYAEKYVERRRTYSSESILFYPCYYNSFLGKYINTFLILKQNHNK